MNSSTKQPGLRRRVLSDHQVAGKTLIPPWVATFGEPEDVSWTDTILPERLWIGLLHRKHGQIEGTKLALDLARFADETSRCPAGGFYGAISDYAILGDPERHRLLQRVRESGALTLYLEAFNPLLAHYPFCPLGFLLEGERLEAAPSLDVLSELVGVLFDKSHRTTVFVQSTFIYLAFVLDRLKVAEDSRSRGSLKSNATLTLKSLGVSLLQCELRLSPSSVSNPTPLARHGPLNSGTAATNSPIVSKPEYGISRPATSDGSLQ